ncbi:MAG TPA: UDP-N-acetylglucosamine 1-carboxyvinyltransferase [Solirubrobacteraceae bacterium]|nr:UDP-N-acetylglucosamine 1-carboxyvinyltransferase [Solirubrobacteraceae bacterium]
MAVTLAEDLARAHPAGPAAPPASSSPARLTGAQPPTSAGSIKLEKFVIEGGTPLSGTITAAGNKNGALPILAACLLTDDEVILRNVPRISDVDAMVTLLQTLGARVQWLGPSEILIDSSTVDSTEVDRDFAERIRASFLLAGPLLARFGSVEMPPPGGDVIGRRRLDPHLDAFRALGARVDERQDAISLTGPPLGLSPCDFLMDEPSVMATENALMAAALTRGPTVIRNAASEPHVQDLARMLMQMGADIEGVGSNVMTVHGQRSLRGCVYEIAPDHIEIGSFMALAGVTGGELIVKDTRPDDLRMIRMVFERLGLRSEVHDDDIIVPGNQELVVRNDHGDHMPKVEDGPWPAFPADLTSIALALATQCDGSVMIHEKMFENRLFFTDKLVSMGAAITICDPHRAIVLGPRKLRGARVESPDIRAGMAMLIAALCAEGVTEIGNIRQIDRGYERIDERLRDLGARITRLEDAPVAA